MRFANAKNLAGASDSSSSVTAARVSSRPRATAPKRSSSGGKHKDGKHKDAKQTAVRQALGEALRDAAESIIHHDTLVADVRRLMAKNETMFVKCFVESLNAIMAADDGAVDERLLAFVERFCNSARLGRTDDDGTYLSVHVLDYVLKLCGVAGSTQRRRACTLVRMLLCGMPAEQELDEGLVHDIVHALCERTTDRNAVTRQEAVRALGRLQSPHNAPPVRDAILSAFTSALSDTDSDVRRAALTCVAVRADTLPLIVARARDVDAGVRSDVYAVLERGKVGVRALDDEQRMAVVRDGLGDRDADVRERCAQLLFDSWLASSRGDLEVLLAAFMNDEGVAATVVAAAIDHRAFDPHFAAVIDCAALTDERALVWRVFTEQCSGTDARVPSLTAIVDALRGIALAHSDGTSHLMFRAKQLLLMCAQLDTAGDEHGRRVLHTLLASMLRTQLVSATDGDEQAQREYRLALDVVRLTVDLMHGICASDVDLIRQVVEAIADLREPLECALPGESQAWTRGGGGGGGGGGGRASSSSLPADNGHSAILLQCTALCHALLFCVELGATVDEQLRMMLAPVVEHTVLPCVLSPCALLRQRGLQCLGLRCLRGDRGAAMQHLPLFTTAAANDSDTDVRLAALQCMLDIGHVYKFTELLPLSAGPGDEGRGATQRDVVALLLRTLVRTRDLALRTCAAEGLCKLLLADAVDEACQLGPLMHLLVLMFAGGDGSSHAALRPLLACFFTTFAHSARLLTQRHFGSLGAAARGALVRKIAARHRLIQHCWVPLHRRMAANVSNARSVFCVEDNAVVGRIGQFMLELLTLPDWLREHDGLPQPSAQEKVAGYILCEALSAPDGRAQRAQLRHLAAIELNGDNACARQLLFLCTLLVSEYTEGRNDTYGGLVNAFRRRLAAHAGTPSEDDKRAAVDYAKRHRREFDKAQQQ